MYSKHQNIIKLIKSRAEGKEEYHPFGTEHDLYNEGVEWVSHTMFPTKKLETPPRIRIGGDNCKPPYDASLLNISAMSFGSLSENTIKAISGVRNLEVFIIIRGQVESVLTT